ncbi:MAG: class I SAM-dependent methyltransferase [Phycisphaerales bacterium]|nr:MAG: class I SAM-dependent methyltransferase [Phycisphaerales bacterium]
MTDSQLQRMRDVLEALAGPYSFLSPRDTLDFFHRKHITNLAHYCDISRCVLVDCGCGHGWNVLAFLLAGGRMAIGVDFEEVKLKIATEFIRILELTDRALFCRASVTNLPVADNGIDLSTCIETLEHLDGGADSALAELQRVTRSAVLVTTPNKLSPIISHDTRLPLAHWMPAGLRRVYAKAFGRLDDDKGNTFLSPFQITRGLRGFRLASRFLAFPSFDAFADSYPHYLPYIGAGTWRTLSGAQRRAYAMIDRIYGRRSFYVLPSLTGVFVSTE